MTGSEGQQRFGSHRHRAIEQPLADRLGQLCTAGLPGDADTMTLPSQQIRKPFDMAALARTVNALEAHETPSCRHGIPRRVSGRFMASGTFF